MNKQRLEAVRKKWLQDNITYERVIFTRFDYSILQNCLYTCRKGKGSNHSINECWIAFDTETSKKHKQKNEDHENHNHVVAWTISIRFFHMNIVTLFGRKPSDLIETLVKIHEALPGEETVFYCHNLPYDYHFLRLFLFQRLGFPENQLNIKSHYPLYIRFKMNKGFITLKDSLMLAQRKLERWAEDMKVDHNKAVGYWQYDKIRDQDERFSFKELSYIECDTIALVECLDKMASVLKKNVSTMVYTATGIVRNDLQKIGKKYRAHDRLKRQALSYPQYIKATKVFHGGFTHGNRYFIDRTILSDLYGEIVAYDFSSSYPFCLLAFKYPCERFTNIGTVDLSYILKYMDERAFMFRLTFINPRLKDGMNPMPFLQYSKCTDTINAIVDNGRICAAAYASIYTTEISLKLLLEQYDYDQILITECEQACKDYLPRWYTDYIFEKFKDKTELKQGDPVLYAIAKSRLNSIYGCSCMKVKDTIIEDYASGDYFIQDQDEEEIYEKYLKKRTTILNYMWGVYCTEYAAVNVHKLGACIDYANGGEWLYTDTDSVYGCIWDNDKLEAYNQNCKDLLKANGYGPVIFEGREYCLGIAELDGIYTSMRICGAKRYCCTKEDGSIKLTVAGVPKKTGAKVLNGNIDNFTNGLIFPGKKTGKLTHTYFYSEEGIYIDDQGNETGDSIDLTPCDYLLSTIDVVYIDPEYEEVNYQVYDE